MTSQSPSSKPLYESIFDFALSLIALSLIVFGAGLLATHLLPTVQCADWVCRGDSASDWARNLKTYGLLLTAFCYGIVYPVLASIGFAMLFHENKMLGLSGQKA